jgi:uncharacterized membrane protein YfcA
MVKIILLVITGVFAGTFSGLIGIGGGIIIIPILTFLFGFTQHQAQGTTLALFVPPIGLLAAYTYYKNGFVNLQAAIFICIGFVVGGWIGSKIAVNLSNFVLQKMFGVLLIVAGLYIVMIRR